MRPEQLLIKQQAREIKRLKRDNDRLRRLTSQYSAAAHAQDDNARLFDSIAEMGRSLGETSYPKYVCSTVKGSSLFYFWMRFVTYFRRFRLASAIIKIATRIILFLQSGAVFIVSTAIFVIMIPITLITSLVTAITALTRGNKLNRHFRKLLNGKKIYVFFPAAAKSGKDSVMAITISQLSQDKDNVIFAVSPYAVSPYMFGKGKFYFTARQSAPNVYYIRKYYYFMLRKKVLSDIGAQVRCIF